MEKEKKKNCWPLAAECPAAAMFVLFVASTRIFSVSEREENPSSKNKFNFLHVN